MRNRRLDSVISFYRLLVDAQPVSSGLAAVFLLVPFQR